MNKKRLIVSLIILILLGALWFVLHQKGPTQRLKPLFSIQPERIDKIEIWTAEDKILLQKEESGWKTMEPFYWDADSTQVNKLFSQVIQAK